MEVKVSGKDQPLALEVLGKRCDGYHEIRTVFQAVDLFDTIRFEPSETLELHCSDPELSGESNLVLKAATILSWATGQPTPARIHLEKAIPYSMGLGGGSSNAAATLMALNEMHHLGCGADELREIAATIGSDVAFFLTGGTALGMGRGEVADAHTHPIGRRCRGDRPVAPAVLRSPVSGLAPGAGYENGEVVFVVDARTLLRRLSHSAHGRKPVPGPAHPRQPLQRI